MDLDRLLELSQPWGMRFVPRRVSLPMPPEGAGGQETKGFFRRLFGGWVDAGSQRGTASIVSCLCTDPVPGSRNAALRCDLLVVLTFTSL